MRLVSAIGMLLIIASLLQGCLAVVALDIALEEERAKRARTEIEREILARPDGDPGPIATVAMIPLGGSPAEQVWQTQVHIARCEIDARGTMDISKAPFAKLATERYVLCMTGRGYRCADRSEHKACANAWIHPTATRRQLLQDSWECREVFRTTIALANTLWARYRECMRSRGYRADVGEMGSLDHESAADEWLSATARTCPGGRARFREVSMSAYAPTGRDDGSILVGACLGPNDEGM
jgi:hypothetical protein